MHYLKSKLASATESVTEWNEYLILMQSMKMKPPDSKSVSVIDWLICVEHGHSVNLWEPEFCLRGTGPNTYCTQGQINV